MFEANTEVLAEEWFQGLARLLFHVHSEGGPKMGADHHLNDYASLAIPSMQIADLIVAYLEQIGVEYVFGIPGGAIEPFYNALARSERRGGVRSIVARHETDAAFMADGYARNSGKLGVCCATTGPGATNLITGVASAYENRTPMLVITAQTALASFGRGALQESSCTAVNIVGMFEYCTQYNTLVSHADQLERKLAAAVMAAFQAPQGPSHISIPLDILKQPILDQTPAFDLKGLILTHKPIDHESVSVLVKELKNAKDIVFVIGDGVRDAIGNILNIALALNAKLVTTPHGKGFISPYHPLFYGVVGFAGHISAKNVLRDKSVDTIVAIGTALTESATDGWDAELILNRRLIHVDAFEGNFTRSPMARLHVCGHLGALFEEVFKALDVHVGETESKTDSPGIESGTNIFDLNNVVDQVIFNDPLKLEADTVPIKPQRLMKDLPKYFPPNTHYLADSGSSLAWAIHYLHPYDRRISGKRESNGCMFWSGLEFASMGWAIGAAIGAAFARPGVPVVCLTGDGSLLMAGQEITVAIQYKLPVIFVVLNDSALGMVKHGQQIANAERIGYELPRIDLAAMARSLGAEGIVISSPYEMCELNFKFICSRKGPTLLDVRVDSEEVPPISSRLKILGTIVETHDACLTLISVPAFNEREMDLA